MRLQFVRVSAVNGRARGRFILASSLATLVLACSAGQALADVSGGIATNFFNGFTVNEGQTGTAILQLSVTNSDASGGAGSTTNRINAGNPITFNSSGAVTTPINVNAAAGNVITTNWNASFQYNLPGTYNVSYGGTVSWQHTANPSYSTGTDNGTGFNGVAGNINVTVNNVAPTITSANINGVNSNLTVNEGAAVSLNMTATDAGSQNTNFIINGGSAGSISGTPGSTRTSSTLSTPGGFLPGVYVQTFQANDGLVDAANGPILRNLTVLNVGPTITSITPSQVIDPSLPFNFTSSATDPGVALGDTLSYNWDWDNDGFFDDYSGASGTIPANYYPLTNGSHIVTLQVTDSYGGVDTDSFTLTVVPEPSTLAMVGLGAAGVGWMARKRRRRK